MKKLTAVIALATLLTPAIASAELSYDAAQISFERLSQSGKRDGFDTILDSDGLGTIAAEHPQGVRRGCKGLLSSKERSEFGEKPQQHTQGNVLAGGDQFGDARVHRDAGGHTYTDPSTGSGQVLGNGNMVVAVLFERSKRQAANDATQSVWGIAA